MNKKLLSITLLFVFNCGVSAFAVTYYSIETGPLTWSNTASWSTISSTGASCGCIPTAADNVIIQAKNTNTIFTVDGNYSITNVTIGSGDANDKKNITLAVGGTNTLTITGALAINAGNTGQTYILDAVAGAINVNGTFPTWGTGGTDNIQLSSGTITFVPAVNLTGGGQNIIFSGAGIINFNSDFTYALDQTSFVTVAGCTVNFAGNYTQNSKNMTFNSGSTENFTGTGKTITPNKNIFFGNLNIASGITITLASAAGQTEVQGNLTLNSSSTFTANAWTGCGGGSVLKCFYVLGDVTLNASSVFNLNENMQCSKNWYNNGGTLNGGSNTVTFVGLGNVIGGSSSTAFPTLQIGNTVNNVSITLSKSITCTQFILDADNSSRTFTFDASNPTMTVNGNATLNQPTGSFTNAWNINGGSATVTGNLIFTGANNTITRIAQLSVTSGSFTLNGNVTWFANAVEATEVISLNTGTITFANSLSMPEQSGTFNVTGSGTVNFNGAAAPSFDLNQTNGGIPDAVFTNSFGSTINFNNGFRNANALIILADGSTAVFTGSGTITPTAAITFGNVKINSGKTVTLAGDISVTDNWTNLGGTFVPGTNTVIFSGTATQTITKTGGETFYNLETNTTGPLTLASNVTVTNNLTMTAGNYNLNGNTLALGNAAASTLSRTAGIMYGGIFKRWWLSGTAVTSANYGLFPIGSSTDYRPVTINSTANPTTAGFVLAQHVDALSVTDVTYTDNEGAAIVRKHDMKDVLSISGLAGGTYNIDVLFTALSSTGTTTDIKLETYTGGAMGSVGTSTATTAPVSAPTVHRTALTASNLQNDWIIATKNSDPVLGTPLRQYYYSRKTGNWSDNTVGSATWSYTAGGAGASCDCKPSSDGYVVISVGNTVAVDVLSTCDFLYIDNTATLNGTANLTVNYDLTTNGNGKFTPTTGTWTISGNASLYGTSNSNTPSGATTITGDLNITTNANLSLTAGLTVGGNFINDGTSSVGANALALTGSAKNISGIGTITGTGTITISGTSSPSYANAGGTGNRGGGIITVAGSFPGIALAGSVSALVDGSFANTFGFNTNAVSIVGDYYRFDFGAGNYKVITEAKFYQDIAASQGTWQWQGSNDAVSWTNIGGTFTLGSSATQTITTLSANTSGYRYYRMLGISGSSNNSAWQREMEFKIDNASASTKTILAGTNLTIAPAIALSSLATVTNNGTITLQNNLTGFANSTWTNAPNSVLNITGALLATGTLNASASPNTVNYNGGGVQNINTPSASAYYNLTASNAGAKTAGANLTISNMLTIQDAATFFDNTNSITGGGGLTMSGTSVYQIQDNTNPVPSLTGTYNLTGGTIDFNLGGNQNGVRSNGLNGPAPSAYYNLTCSGSSGTKTLVGPITVQANLLIAGAAILDVSNSNYAINLYGNWNVTSTNAAPFNKRSGTVTLSGSVAQSITTVLAVGETYYNLTINNTSGGVSLGSNTTATNILTLTSGAVTTGANVFILSNTTAANLIYTNGFVYGTFRRNITSNTSNYFFPVSNGTATTDRHLVSLVNNSLTGTSYLNASVADFTQAAPNVDANLSTTQSGTSTLYTSGEVAGQTVIWTLAPDVAPTGGSYGVQLYVENTNLSATDDNTFYPLKRNVTTSYVNWATNDGTTVIPVNGAAGRIYNSGNGYAQRTGYTSFSQFAIGKGTFPLPIALLSFDATLKGNVVNLNWTTAAEINNDYFTIEKTKEGNTFEEVEKVKGAGNSNTMKEYKVADKNPYKGLSYYRLKQTDFDGKFTYSDLVPINISKADATAVFTVFPNPSDGINIYVSFSSPFGRGQEGTEEVLVVLNDIEGKQVYSKIMITDDSGSFIKAVDLENRVPAGVYFVVGSSRNDIYSRKLIIR